MQCMTEGGKKKKKGNWPSNQAVTWVLTVHQKLLPWKFDKWNFKLEKKDAHLVQSCDFMNI